MRFGSGFYPEAFKLDSFPRSLCEDQASRELVAGPGRGGFQDPCPGAGSADQEPPPLGLRSAGLTPGHRLFPMRNLTPAFPFLY